MFMSTPRPGATVARGIQRGGCAMAAPGLLTSDILGTFPHPFQAERFRTILTSLADLEVSVVVTVGEDVDPATLGQQHPPLLERLDPLGREWRTLRVAAGGASPERTFHFTVRAHIRLNRKTTWF